MCTRNGQYFESRKPLNPEGNDLASRRTNFENRSEALEFVMSVQKDGSSSQSTQKKINKQLRKATAQRNCQFTLITLAREGYPLAKLD